MAQQPKIIHHTPNQIPTNNPPTVQQLDNVLITPNIQPISNQNPSKPLHGILKKTDTVAITISNPATELINEMQAVVTEIKSDNIENDATPMDTTPSDEPKRKPPSWKIKLKGNRLKFANLGLTLPSY